MVISLLDGYQSSAIPAALEFYLTPLTHFGAKNFPERKSYRRTRMRA